MMYHPYFLRKINYEVKRILLNLPILKKSVDGKPSNLKMSRNRSLNRDSGKKISYWTGSGNKIVIRTAR